MCKQIHNTLPHRCGCLLARWKKPSAPLKAPGTQRVQHVAWPQDLQVTGKSSLPLSYASLHPPASDRSPCSAALHLGSSVVVLRPRFQSFSMNALVLRSCRSLATASYSVQSGVSNLCLTSSCNHSPPKQNSKKDMHIKKPD